MAGPACPRAPAARTRSPSRRAAAARSARCPPWPCAGRSPRRRARGPCGTARGRPATTPTRPVTDCVRRIRPMIAATSSTCMARSSRPRLVTCGEPATAATMGERAMRAAASRSASGCRWVSASMTATSGCRACAKAGVELLRLAAVDRVAQHAAAPITGGGRARRRLGAVGGTVIEHEHLEHGVVRGERCRDAQVDHALLVVRRDQHGDPRPASLRLLGFVPLLEHPEHEAARHPQRRGAHRVQRDEDQQRVSDRAQTASPVDVARRTPTRARAPR